MFELFFACAVLFFFFDYGFRELQKVFYRCADIYIFEYIYIYIYIYMQLHMHIYVYTYTHTYIKRYIFYSQNMCIFRKLLKYPSFFLVSLSHAHTHTHTHTHIYIYIYDDDSHNFTDVYLPNYKSNILIYQ